MQAYGKIFLPYDTNGEDTHIFRQTDRNGPGLQYIVDEKQNMAEYFDTYDHSLFYYITSTSEAKHTSHVLTLGPHFGVLSFVGACPFFASDRRFRFFFLCSWT